MRSSHALFVLAAVALSVQAIVVFTPREARACQPEPAVFYITNTLPTEGDTVSRDTPIAIRWSAKVPIQSDPEPVVIHAYLHDEMLQISEFELIAQEGGLLVEGEIRQGEREGEQLFVPGEPLKPAARYTARAVVLNYDTPYEISWTFQTNQELAEALPEGQAIKIEELSAEEVAVKTFRQCEYNPEVDFCYAPSVHDGWTYPTVYTMKFSAPDPDQHSASIYRYVLRRHVSMEDTEGAVMDVVDVTKAGEHTLRFVRSWPMMESTCFSLTAVPSGDGTEAPTPKISCYDPRFEPIERQAEPDGLCPEDETEREEERGEGRRPRRGWTLSDRDDDDGAPRRDEGCGGCSSATSAETLPGSALLALLGGLALGGLGRRRRAPQGS